MAGSADVRPQTPSDRQQFDPVLEKLVATATFDCDWPTLRHHLYLALLASVPLFLELGPPQSQTGRARLRPRSPSVHGSSVGGEAPEGLLISPSGRAWSADSVSSDSSSSGSSPLRVPGPRPTLGEGEQDASLRPSTPGGLVIPPFPPLDPQRRRRSISAGIPGAPRMNGGPGPMPGVGGNPFDEEWDDDVVIGGRKLTGWMGPDESRQQVERVARELEDLSYPPFTVQRLAELLLAPTRLHSSLGKFLRAVEKTLTVTTAFSPPSYVYVAPSFLPPSGVPLSPASSTGTVITEASMDSTVPPGSMTPMFSPIPFLIQDDDMGGGSLAGGDGERGDEGLMSPLMLGDSEAAVGGSGVFAEQQELSAEEKEKRDAGAGEGGDDDDEQPRTIRSATPEPEEEDPHRDPGRQDYLGRVDELDSGPLRREANGHATGLGITNGPSPTRNGSGSGSGAGNGHQTAETARTGGETDVRGVGEGGAMTPHGMSDRPVPISSTTVISGERDIAPLPRSRRSSVGSVASVASVAASESGAGAGAGSVSGEDVDMDSPSKESGSESESEKESSTSETSVPAEGDKEQVDVKTEAEGDKGDKGDKGSPSAASTPVSASATPAAGSTDQPAAAKKK